MIDGTTLKFGYGDIAVGNRVYAETFRWFKPAQEVGTSITTEVEWLSEEVRMEFSSLDEISAFKRLLIGVTNKDIYEFSYKGLHFDFTNYNQKSAIMVLKHLKEIENNFLMLVAA